MRFSMVEHYASEDDELELEDDGLTIANSGHRSKYSDYSLGKEVDMNEEYHKVRGLLDMSEQPETTDDLKRWAENWGVDEELVFEVFQKEFGGRYDDGEPSSYEYDPSGEPDAMDTADDKVLDFFKSADDDKERDEVMKADEDYGKGF